MTTKKAYEAQVLQQVYSDARMGKNHKLLAILDEAWWTCETIDPYCEWSDNDIATTIEALREAGKDTMVAKLVAELVNAYGEDEVEVADWRDWQEW